MKMKRRVRWYQNPDNERIKFFPPREGIHQGSAGGFITDSEDRETTALEDWWHIGEKLATGKQAILTEAECDKLAGVCWYFSQGGMPPTHAVFPPLVKGTKGGNKPKDQSHIAKFVKRRTEDVGRAEAIREAANKYCCSEDNIKKILKKYRGKESKVAV